MKTLIAYFSRNGENWFDGQKTFLEEGNTRKLAYMIQKELDGDLFEIIMKEPYPEDYDSCCKKAYEDQKNNERPLLLADVDIKGYDEIYLCYPIYWESCPMAVLSFVKNKDFTNRKVHLLTTHEGSGLGDSKYKIEQENGTIHVSSALPVIGSMVGQSEELVKKHISKIRE